MSVQDLARSLAAAGFARAVDDDEGGIYILNVDDGQLMEKLWVNGSVRSEEEVASDAKEGTSAPYLLDEENNVRLVVFVDQSNTVQCYTYDEDTLEWEQSDLGEEWGLKTSPDSKLSACFGPESEIVVSYQDTAGRLAGVMSAGEKGWTKFGPLEADAIAGTPQCLEVIDDKLHLFHVCQDGRIGYLVLDPDTGKWQGRKTGGNVLLADPFDTPIDNFTVAKNPETKSFQSYYLTAGTMWSVEGTKAGKEKVGMVEANGTFIPADNAQCGWRVWWGGARRIVQVRFNFSFSRSSWC